MRILKDAALRLKDASIVELQMLAIHDPDMIREVAAVCSSYIANPPSARPEEAIREAALEESAQVADNSSSDNISSEMGKDWERGVNDASLIIADRIRALKSKSAHSPAPRVDEAEAREVVQAACALIASDINVYPNMSRADAVASGYARLNKAVDHYNSAQPACASPSVAP